jgi:hypothetical protein
MRKINVVGYSLYLKESIKFNILSSPVRLNCEDLSIKFAFNKFMKVKKGKKRRYQEKS